MVLHIVYSDKIAVLQLTTVDDLPPAMSVPSDSNAQFRDCLEEIRMNHAAIRSQAST